MRNGSALAIAVAGALWLSACGARTELVSAGSGSGMGPACANDGTVTLASGDGPGDVPFAIAVDATSVYWPLNPGVVPPAQGRILSVPKCGGAPFTLASGQAGPAGLVVDETRAYWTNPSANAAGTVMSVPVAGGDVVTLAQTGDPLGH